LMELLAGPVCIPPAPGELKMLGVCLVEAFLGLLQDAATAACTDMAATLMVRPLPFSELSEFLGCWVGGAGVWCNAVLFRRILLTCTQRAGHCSCQSRFRSLQNSRCLQLMQHISVCLITRHCTRCWWCSHCAVLLCADLCCARCGAAMYHSRAVVRRTAP
jgi:hypothetical protein